MSFFTANRPNAQQPGNRPIWNAPPDMTLGQMAPTPTSTTGMVPGMTQPMPPGQPGQTLGQIGAPLAPSTLSGGQSFFSRFKPAVAAAQAAAAAQGAGPTPPSGTAPAGPKPPNGAGQDPLALIQQWQKELPPNAASFAEIVKRLNALGIKATLATHAGGKPSGDKIVLPDGRMFDIAGLDDAGVPNTWKFAHVSNTLPTDQVIGPDGKVTTFGDYAKANNLGTPDYAGAANPQAGGGQTPGGAGGSSGLFNGLDPFTEQFTAPTGEQAANTPGYQFALNEGLKGVERGAAAKGTLLTGGTLKGLFEYGSGIADQTYGNTYNRAFQEYLTRHGIYSQNANDLFSRNFSLGQLGAQSAGALSNASQNSASGFTDTTLGQGNVNASGITAGANATNAAIGTIGNTIQDYLARRRANQAANQGAY